MWRFSRYFFNLENALTEAPNPEDEISFHFSFGDAEENENPIDNPNDYNPTNLIETIYLRIFDGNCFAVNSFEIQTLLPPQITNPSVFAECDFSTEQEGFTAFDLTTTIPEITGGNPDYAVEFFYNPS